MKDILFFGAGIAVSIGYLYYKDSPSVLAAITGATNNATPTQPSASSTTQVPVVPAQPSLIHDVAPTDTQTILDFATTVTEPVIKQHPVLISDNVLVATGQVEDFYKATGDGSFSYSPYNDPNVLKRPIAVATVNSIYKQPAFLNDFTPLTTNN